MVSRESVQTAFNYAVLNGVDIFAADIQNAYLQYPSSQKAYIRFDPEFGLENVGKVALIHIGLVSVEDNRARQRKPFEILYETYGLYLVSR